MPSSLKIGGMNALRHIVLLSGVAILAPLPALAQICDLPVPVKPADFPDQPINIFIPRSSASGSLGLNEEIAKAIRALKDENGNDLNIQVNTLFKFGGDLHAALDYFFDLPPNGYNVIQLTDTYASLLADSAAGAEGADDRLVPLSLAQITLSQLYIRRSDPNFSDLDGFVSYASSRGTDGETAPVQIALFGTKGEQFGLEDILLDKFATTFATGTLTASSVAPPPPEPAAGAAAPPPASPELAIGPVGFESGSARYFSLFGASPETGSRVDALIEQPGDVARLINGGLIKPIFTFLPEQDLNAGVAADLRARLGTTESFPQKGSEHCAIYYRYRGFFIPEGVPPERRQFLEWVFRKAFDSDSFRAFNHAEYMDVLYQDPDIAATYCETPQLTAFYQNSIREYRECLSDGAAASPGP